MLDQRFALMRKELMSRGYPPEKWAEVPAKVWHEFGMNPPDFTPPPPLKPACETCHDDGWVIVNTPGHPLNGKPYPCPRCDRGREAGQRYFERNLKSSGLPQHYQGMSFDSFRTMPKDLRTNKMLAYGCALAFASCDHHWFQVSDGYRLLNAKVPEIKVDPVRNSLVLYGPYGVGKTGLAAAIVNYLLGSEIVLYIRVQDLLHAVQKTYDRDYEGESRDQIVLRIKTAPILVIDEFSLLTVSNDRNEIMEEIMRYRCGHELPFVVTTNDAPEVFRKKWDGRIVEVMLEAAHWIPMGAPVLREQSQPE